MSLFVPRREAAAHPDRRARGVRRDRRRATRVVATLALALAAGAALPEAAVLANLAAGVVVGKLGTATAGPEELLAGDRAPGCRREGRGRGRGPRGLARSRGSSRRDGGSRHDLRRVPSAREAVRRRAHGQGAAPCCRRRPPTDPLPARLRGPLPSSSPGTASASISTLTRPVAIASRPDLDGWLLRRAVGAGAAHVAERVIEVDGNGGLRTAGRHGVLRRSWSAPTARAAWCGARSLGADAARAPDHGGRAGSRPATSEMTVRFLPGLAGYLWLFPRLDHVGVGICAPLAARAHRASCSPACAREVARSFPALADEEAATYAHTIPSPSTDPASLREIAGARWALVGDAAALADPITGEGIYYALRSAVVLADTLRDGRSPARYPERAAGGLRARAAEGGRAAPALLRAGLHAAHARASPRRSAAIRDRAGRPGAGRPGIRGAQAPAVAQRRRASPSSTRRPRSAPPERRRRQWRKCRTPVKTIASLCSSAAAITSSSFTEPPGWMTAVAPALRDLVDAVAEREEGVGGDHRARGRELRLQGGEARGVDAAHLARAHADRLPAVRVDDRVRLHVLAHGPGEHGARATRRRSACASTPPRTSRGRAGAGPSPGPARRPSPGAGRSP